mmetsp:Transcript_36795/g.83274  ORF Transcript_36795/g.83274 Transcript_36795/m.83274 type:complete len:95 (-) Transcript_36795:607-891(-)
MTKAQSTHASGGGRNTLPPSWFLHNYATAGGHNALVPAVGCAKWERRPRRFCPDAICDGTEAPIFDPTPPPLRIAGGLLLVGAVPVLVRDANRR